MTIMPIGSAATRQQPRRPYAANLVLGTCLFAALAACSGEAPSSESATAVTASPVTTVATTARPTAAPTTATEAPRPDHIDLQTTIDGEKVSQTIDITDATTTDPFQDFGACSGLRDFFGAYSVVLSSADPALGSVEVNTIVTPQKPGRVDAQARIERGDVVLESNGYMELTDDFRSGQFVGVAASGQSVNVSFDCVSQRTPRPLDRTRTFTEIAGRLTRGPQRRILSSAGRTPCRDGLIDAAAPDDDIDSFGGFSAVRVVDKTIALRLGVRDLVLANSAVQLGATGSGTFTATTEDGVAIVGAFSCRS